MELWVRSQDKKNLVKVINQISLNYCDKKTIIANYIPDFIGTQGEYYEKMGTYKSEERALEVLDEIQRILQPTLFIKDEQESFIGKDGNIYKINVEGMKNSEIQELSTYVYEMPEE